MEKVLLFDIKIGKKLGKAKNLLVAKPHTEAQRTRDTETWEPSRW
jgi:hypothetical protein